MYQAYGEAVGRLVQEHEISQREAQRVAANDEGQEIHGGSF